jgi:2-polyprenyl-3-methyl-5-hydroxy-6-metoxy-1,4-benzoquinol methylase
VSHPACLVCGGTFARHDIPGLLGCRTCGFVSADIALTDEELAALYSARYFQGEEYRDYFAERDLIERQCRRRLSMLLKFVPAAASKQLFEIGSAYGFFLSVASKAFRGVRGIDISADAAEAARTRVGVDVATGDFLSAPISGPIDVVCLWDTIEHLAFPGRYLERAAAMMPPGGTIAISTGDIDSVVARLRGAKWRQIHPPTHLHYFSRRTLTRLLNAHGFDVAHVEHEGVYRSVDTMAFITLTIKHRQERLYRWLKSTRLLNWTLYLNLYDTVLIIATKRAGPPP